MSRTLTASEQQARLRLAIEDIAPRHAALPSFSGAGAGKRGQGGVTRGDVLDRQAQAGLLFGCGQSAAHHVPHSRANRPTSPSAKTAPITKPTLPSGRGRGDRAGGADSSARS